MNFFFAGRTNPILMAYLKILRVTSVLACVASVSSRVIARKLEREQKKIPFFFLSSQLSRRTRAETLAMQATSVSAVAPQ